MDVTGEGKKWIIIIWIWLCTMDLSILAQWQAYQEPRPNFIARGNEIT
jgi:hypothetical protein